MKSEIGGRGTSLRGGESSENVGREVVGATIPSRNTSGMQVVRKEGSQEGSIGYILKRLRPSMVQLDHPSCSHAPHVNKNLETETLKFDISTIRR